MGSCQRHLWPQSDLWPLWRKVLRDVGCKEMHPPFCSWHVRPCKLGITCQWCFGADLVWSHTFVHCYSLGEWSPDAQVTDNGYSAWAWLGFRQNGPRARKGRDAEASSKRCWSCWCAPWAAAKCSLGGLYSGGHGFLHVFRRVIREDLLSHHIDLVSILQKNTPLIDFGHVSP